MRNPHEEQPVPTCHCCWTPFYEVEKAYPIPGFCEEWVCQSCLPKYIREHSLDFVNEYMTEIVDMVIETEGEVPELSD